MAMESLNDLQYDSLKGAYFKFDPNDALPDYVGIHQHTDAEDENPDWIVYKFTYSGSDVTQIMKKRGAWSSRATMF